MQCALFFSLALSLHTAHLQSQLSSGILNEHAKVCSAVTLNTLSSYIVSRSVILSLSNTLSLSHLVASLFFSSLSLSLFFFYLFLSFVFFLSLRNVLLYTNVQVTPTRFDSSRHCVVDVAIVTALCVYVVRTGVQRKCDNL